MPNLIEIGPVVMEKMILKQEAHGPRRSPEKTVHIITLIKGRKKKIYEKLLVLHLKKLEHP